MTDSAVEALFEPLDVDQRVISRGDVTPWGTEQRNVFKFGTSGRQPPDAVLGSHDDFAAIEAQVINYVGQVHTSRPTIKAQAGGWTVTVTRTPQTEERLDRLRLDGGHACTHVARITRTDGSTFGFDDAQPILEAIWHLCSFAAGAHVGIALPVGFDAQGLSAGVQHRIYPPDSYRARLSWLDDFHVHDVGPLFESWFRLADDPFWHSVIRRAIRACVTANGSSPLDTSIVTALSCLELLAWATLQVEAGWLDLPRDGELHLAGRLRLLLRWAGIDPAVPAQLPALTQLISSDKNIPDGPAAIAWTRNRSVHPPRLAKDGTPGWPSSDQLHEAWRLALEYADLVLLRLLGHTGAYGSRLHLNGRWMGSVVQVPWAPGADGALT